MDIKFFHVKHLLVGIMPVVFFKFHDLWMHGSILQPAYSLRTYAGHSTTVTSLDFHPTKDDLICSCDNNSEIRYWSIKNGRCAGVLKVYSLTSHSQEMVLYNAYRCFSFANPIFTISAFLFFAFNQGGGTKIRFQPRVGRFLAAAADNSVSLLDVEAQVCRAKLQVSWEVAIVIF